MDNAERKARAQRRRESATLCRSTLSLQDRDPFPTRGEQALSLVSRLTRESWSFSRREQPRYDRMSTPYRFVRGPLT